VIVVDASAALSALLNAGTARVTLASERLHAPHLIDAEVADGLRRHVAAGGLAPTAGWVALDTWRRLGMTRYAHLSMLERVWELRDNVSSYDAIYVALAEHLGCALLTADGRLSRASGIRCAVTSCRADARRERELPALARASARENEAMRASSSSPSSTSPWTRGSPHGKFQPSSRRGTT
jgi:predicted nucleic acid-binding protein